MNINKPVKILIGILTLFTVLMPFIMPVFVIFFMFGFGFPFFDPYATPDPGEFERTLMPMMMLFYPAMMCYSVVQLGLQIFYVIHEVKNKVLTDTFRILFVIGTFLLSYIAMPVYYFMYVWKDSNKEVLPAQAETNN